jgi:nucleotide-binding universal stress UspA family protein
MKTQHEKTDFESNSIKKVLIALDYDTNSNFIAKLGHQIAQNNGAETILLHIVANEANYAPMQFDPVMASVGGFDYNVFTEVADAKGFVDAAYYYLEKIKHHLNDDTITILVKVGDTADEILENAIQLHADLIVMGTHSKKWLEKILIGSAAQSVLENTKIPLLVVPTKNKN